MTWNRVTRTNGAGPVTSYIVEILDVTNPGNAWVPPAPPTYSSQPVHKPPPSISSEPEVLASGSDYFSPFTPARKH